MQLKALRKTLSIGLMASAMALPATGYAYDVEDMDDDSPGVGVMVADAVVVRPLYFLLSQAGAVVYTATLPFTLLGGNADEAAEKMVVTPLQSAFVRCLGCGNVTYEVDSTREGEGKTVDHFVEVNLGNAGYSAESEKVTSVPRGVYIGTHWELIDDSRFDVMLGHIKFGDATFKNSDVGAFTDSLSSTQIATRFGMNAFRGVDVMFKLGLHRWSVSREFDAGGSASTNGFGFLYGVGIESRMADEFGLGLNYTRYDLEDTSAGYDAGINSVDMGLRFYF